MAKRFAIETYGCQMNKADSELVTAILENEGWTPVDDLGEADLILVNTCGVREHAERRVLGRLDQLKVLKKRTPGVKIGVLGCMAQRLSRRIIKEKPFVNLIMGPDSYRKLPQYLDGPSTCYRDVIIDDQLDTTETYEGIFPVRRSGISAWVTIMRGCNNFCSYCVVPYTRGRERSRPLDSIMGEVRNLTDRGFLEVTLLGQNVNSYRDDDHDFLSLLEKVSRTPGIKRVRFTTSHPKDLSKQLLEVMAETDVICNHIHLPVQSGSDHILKRMNRKYTREQYVALVHKIREMIPDVGLTTDIMVGFPGESPRDFEETLTLVDEVGFDSAFTFRYSVREGTSAARLTDDVLEGEKIERLNRLIELQQGITEEKYQKMVGRTVEVLLEGESKRNPREMVGRADDYKMVVLPGDGCAGRDFVRAKITRASGHTLFGDPVI
ncbi:tRNA (N6-isopentenyl adenosine(37)-C2)-methylthiotransferase MiaB [candidate division KSB1 bacterium]|nr:tRNA (N6-isopentenyl adenosine(37)-C2)-methylthiotransferase MiaB [candidate division KSB1 bacterium]